MSKMFQVYGIGQALIPVLPPPLPFENPPTVNQTNYEIGQLVYSPPTAPTGFYIYAGSGSWVQFAAGTGVVLAVNGTASEITATTTAGVVTLSIPAAFVAPGSIDATTSITATAGNIVATNGDLVLATTGNKLVIATGNNGSVGTTTAMVGGAVTVTTGAVTTSSTVIYSRATLGTSEGQISISAQTNGSFTLTSSSGTETSTFNYLIIN